jgi:hypothetical protein
LPLEETLKKILLMLPILLMSFTGSGVSAREQTWTGTISDSMCGASHAKRAEAGHLTERECVIECIKGLTEYVLVDANHNVIRIVNQDFVGLPFRAGRAVKITGELKDGAIVITSLESAADE